MSKEKAAQFGLKLRELREAAGLTQALLAFRAGLHAQAIVKLERGEREPAWSTLVALAAALDVSVGAFAGEASGKPAKRMPGRPPKATPATPPAADLEAEAKIPRGRQRPQLQPLPNPQSSAQPPGGPPGISKETKKPEQPRASGKLRRARTRKGGNR